MKKAEGGGEVFNTVAVEEKVERKHRQWRKVTIFSINICMVLCSMLESLAQSEIVSFFLSDFFLKQG